MKFDDIQGHGTQIAALRRAVASDRLHHAYLLAGPDGVGKHMVGRALCAAANCGNPDDGQACGECGPCRKFAHGNFPDFVPIPPPLPDDEPPPKTDAIKIEQIRDLRQTMGFPPFEGKCRAVLVDGAQNMTEEAANALLKMLEEPRPGTLFVLVTGNPLALLPTIHSRCQTVHFGPLPDAVVETLIAAMDDVPEEAVPLLAAWAAGSPGRATTADLEFLLQKRPELIAQIASLPGKGAVDAIALGETMLETEPDLMKLATLLRTFYRDVAVWQATGSAGVLIHADLAGTVQSAAARLKPRDVRRCLAAIARMERRQKNNVRKQYAVEGLALELARPARITT